MDGIDFTGVRQGKDQQQQGSCSKINLFYFKLLQYLSELSLHPTFLSLRMNDMHSGSGNGKCIIISMF